MSLYFFRDIFYFSVFISDKGFWHLKISNKLVLFIVKAHNVPKSSIKNRAWWWSLLLIAPQVKRCHQSGYIQTHSKEAIRDSASRRVTLLPVIDRTSHEQQHRSGQRCHGWSHGKTRVLLDWLRWASIINFRDLKAMYKHISMSAKLMNLSNFVATVAAISVSL